MAVLPGQILTDTRANAISPEVRVRAYATVNTACANNVLTLIPLGGESYDTASMHSTGVNPSRVIATVAGGYDLKVQGSFATNATGRRVITIRKNAGGSSGSGVQVAQLSIAASPTSGTGVNFTTDLQLAAGDQLEIFALQTSGGGLDVVSGDDSTWMSLRLVDPS